MNLISRLRSTPVAVRVASLLVSARFAVSVVALLVGVVVQGVAGPSDLRDPRTGHVPSVAVTVVILIVQFAGVLIWLLLPVILLVPVSRGYLWGRWVLSGIAAVNLLFSLSSVQRALVWIPSTMLLVGAALLWAPSSRRFFANAPE